MGDEANDAEVERDCCSSGPAGPRARKAAAGWGRLPTASSRVVAAAAAARPKAPARGGLRSLRLLLLLRLLLVAIVGRWWGSGSCCAWDGGRPVWGWDG